MNLPFVDWENIWSLFCLNDSLSVEMFFHIYFWFLGSQSITVISTQPSFNYILGETLTELIYPFKYDNYAYILEAFDPE